MTVKLVITVSKVYILGVHKTSNFSVSVNYFCFT